ncbi:MAG: hypothetical protein K2Q29_13155 [Sphingomonadales bacterium]|nr:hypothetical protein [Sphingomonadales bacterium]
MGKIHHIKPGKPRKLGEVAWTEGGLRLSPMQCAADSGWFWPAMLTFPVGAFLIVFFW